PTAPGDRAGPRPDRRRGNRPGRVHERTHRRLRRCLMSTTHTLVLLSVLLAIVVVAVVAVALIEVRKRLATTSANLAALAVALSTVEEEHLRPLEPAVKAINAQFDIILSALPGIAKKAALVAERRPR